MSKLVIGVVILLIVGGGAFYLLKANGTTNPSPAQTQTQTNSPTAEPTADDHMAMEKENSEKTVTVTLTSSGFSPATITVDKGTKVVWKNESGQTATVNSDPHPIHTNYSPLNLGNFDNGDTLSLTFTTSGTYGYHNHLNSAEKGTVTVK